MILRRQKKLETLNHSGNGTWKIAYADFVTAMMVFFLLLWVLNENNRSVAIAEYFHDPAKFQDGRNSKAVNGQNSNNVAVASPVSSMAAGTGTGNSKDSGLSLDETVKRVRQSFVDLLGNDVEHVLVDVHEGGVRIQITDKEGEEMFALGSATPTAKAKIILEVVSDNMRDIPGSIVIEGHTDSAQYKGKQMSNWELSSARASSARRLLEDNGIEASRVSRVTGYADKSLLDSKDPLNPINRRISIIILDKT